MILPFLLIAAGGAVAAALLASNDESVPEHDPDVPLPAAPGPTGLPTTTGYKLVDKILPDLQTSASSSGYPLGLMVAWVACESGGKLSEVTSLDERGYYQLMPAESKTLGLDHQRLSTDYAYSIASGPLLITHYAAAADKYGIFPKGSSAYYLLTKLGHTMGSGDVKKIVDGAVAVGATGSWGAFEAYALSGAAKTKGSPKKWFPFLRKIYAIGKPFGFGSDATMVSGFYDPDGALPPFDAEQFRNPPLVDCVARGQASEDREALARAVENAGGSDCTEQQAVAWAIRNRAAKNGTSIAEASAIVPSNLSPSEWSRTVAAAVLSQPQDEDPTSGAVDFWRPDAQRHGHALAQLYQAHVQHDDLVGAAEFEPWRDYGSETEARNEIEGKGLRIVGVVGTLELYG